MDTRHVLTGSNLKRKLKVIECNHMCHVPDTDNGIVQINKLSKTYNARRWYSSIVSLHPGRTSKSAQSKLMRNQNSVLRT